MRLLELSSEVIEEIKDQGICDKSVIHGLSLYSDFVNTFLSRLIRDENKEVIVFENNNDNGSTIFKMVIDDLKKSYAVMNTYHPITDDEKEFIIGYTATYISAGINSIIEAVGRKIDFLDIGSVVVHANNGEFSVRVVSR